MGIVNGVENRVAMQQLFSFLAEQFDIGTFVETGTYQGETAHWASSRFSRVITIEGAEALYHQARLRLNTCANVECQWGDSRTLLPKIAREVSATKLYWLDAHWSGGPTFGEHAECPLIDELVGIYESGEEPFVVVDDARFFISLPPVPHDIHSWPSYFEIADAVRRRASDTFITIHADAIVLAPAWSTEKLIPFLRGQPAAAEDSPQHESMLVRWWKHWRQSA